MSGLNHEFFLVSAEKYCYEDYPRFIGISPGAELHDDIIHYLADSLNWIPTFNPAKKEGAQGLCLYGATVIEAAGAPVAKAVFEAWANLLSLGPSRLDLTGLWIFEEGVLPTERRYDRIFLNRDAIVEKLRTLAEYANKVTASQGDYFILHLGV